MANILIVDDAAFMRDNLKYILEKVGHKVVGLAGDGKEAIRLYKTLRPDIVTMDDVMPDMSGTQALKAIKKYDPDAKVIMVTALGQKRIMDSALKLGASGYITKPFTEAGIVEEIKKVLAGKGSHQKTGDDITRLLHVEDSKMAYTVVMELLRKKGLEYAVDWAATVSDAMKMLGEKQYDLILLDYMLPDGTGLDLLEKTKGTPVVFFIGKGNEMVAVEAMKQGAYDYVTKDLDGVYLDLLPAVIERALQAARLKKEKEEAEADAKIRDSEERYRALFTQLPFGVVLIDPETMTPLEFNETAHTQLGYSREEFARLRIEDYESVETPEEIKVRIGKLLFAQKTDFETRHRTKDGDIRNILVTAQIIEAHGKPVLNCIFYDITEFKRAEAEVLRLKVEREQRVTKRTALGYTFRITEVVFIVEFLIMMFLLLFPIKHGFIEGLIDSILLVIILSPALYKFVYQPLIRQIKHHLRTQNELEESAIKLKEYSHNLEEIVDAKVKELLKISARESVMLENSNDAVITCDSDRKIVFWNRMAEEIFGYSKEEIIGKDTLLIVPEQYKERHNEGFRRAIQKGRISSRKLYSVEGLRKDGTLIPVEISLSIYKSNGELLVTAIMRDITERRVFETRIKHQLDRLSALRSIDMAITSSLDWRVTLNVIIEEIFKAIHVDAADVLLINPNTLRLEYVAGKGFRTKVFQSTHLRLGEGHAGKAALENRSIYISNINEEGGDLLRAQLLSKEEFISYLCVPLITKGTIKGVIEMFYRTKYEPDPEMLDFAEAIALQAAIAIDSASMFNDLQRSNIELLLAYDTTIEGWSKALDLRDKETEGHSQRVTEMTVHIARDMGMSEEELIHVRRGALLHDIGKMGIPDNILLKPGKLNDEEWVSMRKHPAFAYALLFPISYLHHALDIPYCHHEKWDGTGYPRGLKGEQIPVSARIFSIVDVWDALRSDRPYRPAWPKERALEHIKSLSGIDFDPKVVEVFMRLSSEEISEKKGVI